MGRMRAGNLHGKDGRMEGWKIGRIAFTILPTFQPSASISSSEWADST